MVYSQFYALRGQILFNGYFAHVSIVVKKEMSYFIGYLFVRFTNIAFNFMKF